ncbi:MAG: SCP2 sterol-binding domain-containing protein [Promethearchaeota archaeon]
MMMDIDEINNIKATFKASLDAIFIEKLEKEEWKKKLKNVKAYINLIILNNEKDGNEQERIYMGLKIENGSITLEDRKLTPSDFDLEATFDTFFKIAIKKENAIVAMLKGKLKIKRMLGNLKKIMLLQKLLTLENE